MLLKISDPDAPLCEERKLLARRLTGASKRGVVAENQISWLRNKIGEVAQNPPNRMIAKDLEMYMPLLATDDDPDEGRKGRKMRKPPVQLWYLRYLQSCVNDDSIRADKLGSIEYFRENLKKAAREMGVEISDNHGILGDCVVCSYGAQIFSSGSHSSPAEIAHAAKIEQLHSHMIQRLRNEVKDDQQKSARYFQGLGGDTIYLEQDGVGKHNTFVPFLSNNRSKSASSPSELLQLHYMMHIVAGLGLYIVWAPPFVRGGSDFNMTCWWTVLMDVTITRGHKLPRHLKFHSDRGDGNWSVVQLAFDGLLCALGAAQEVTRGAFPKDHGHGDGDSEMAVNRHYRYGNRRTDSCTGHCVLVPQSYGDPKIEKWSEDEYDVSVEGSLLKAYNSKKERLKRVMYVSGTRYTIRCVHCTIRACAIRSVVYTASSVHALYYPLCTLHHPCMRYTIRCVHCTIHACTILHINT
jgi:hypothetical protein